MDTETKLIASHDDIAELIKLLAEARDKSIENGQAQYVNMTLEQMVHKGPWRLTVCVLPG